MHSESQTPVEVPPAASTEVSRKTPNEWPSVFARQRCHPCNPIQVHRTCPPPDWRCPAQLISLAGRWPASRLGSARTWDLSGKMSFEFPVFLYSGFRAPFEKPCSLFCSPRAIRPHPWHMPRHLPDTMGSERVQYQHRRVQQEFTLASVRA